MISDNRPRAVLFDLFETLVTEFADGRRRARREFDYRSLLGLDNDTFRKEWNARVMRRMTGELDFFAVIREMLDARGLPWPEETARMLYEERVREKRAVFSGIDPDIIRMLARLKGMGLRLCLVSNCSEEEVRGWDDCDLAPFFDEVVFSCEVAAAKPAPVIYRIALERIGASPGAGGVRGRRRVARARRRGARRHPAAARVLVQPDDSFRLSENASSERGGRSRRTDVEGGSACR